LPTDETLRQKLEDADLNVYSAEQDLDIINQTYADESPAGGMTTGEVPAPTTGTAPSKISTDAEYLALPSGSEYIDPSGKKRRKP
jgi:hypothetical protein